MQTPGSRLSLRGTGEGTGTLGRYVVGREIGRGGMGSVYEATHRALGKRVAIKQFHAHAAPNADALARFVREGRAVAQVRHPHVVEVFDLDDSDDGAPFLVMELLDGCTLADRLENGAPFSLSEAADMALPLVSALSAAHSAGVVHRDIKPSNIFLRGGLPTDPCIVDFGVSKHAEVARVDSLTESGTLLGTYPYFSPEHTRGAKNVGPPSDQYSLAAVLYECVAGKRPFEGETPYELMHAIVTSDVRPPSHVRPSIPRDFDEVLLRAMDRDPARRYRSMEALGSALIGFASRRSWHVWSREFAGPGSSSLAQAPLERTTAESLAVAATKPPPPARRRLAFPLAIAAACLLAGIATLRRAPAETVSVASATSVPPHSERPAPSAGVASVEVQAEAPKPKSPEAAALKPEPSVAAVSSAETPSRAAPTGVAIPRSAGAKPAQPHVPARSTSVTSSASAPDASAKPGPGPERGSNGVAIIE